METVLRDLIKESWHTGIVYDMYNYYLWMRFDVFMSYEKFKPLLSDVLMAKGFKIDWTTSEKSLSLTRI
jgi:hypothetical protein